MIQHENSLESEHYKKFKTAVELCKASGINFSLMCSTNADMAIKELKNLDKSRRLALSKMVPTLTLKMMSLF